MKEREKRMEYAGRISSFHAGVESQERLSIFVVEDDGFYRQGLVELISRHSPFVVAGQADNGIDAVKLARDLQPDIVLLDQSLPFLNWLEAARTIRIVSKKSKVLILSLDRYEEYMHAAFDAGASGYLVKQAIDANSLIDAIDAVFRGDNPVTIGIEEKKAEPFYGKLDLQCQPICD